MSQYVIEFGAEQLRFVADAIKSILPITRQICIASSHDEMSYIETGRTFDEVLDDMAVGTAASVVVRANDPRIRYALITSPKIHTPPLALWMGTIEIGIEDWRFAWEALLAQIGLRFVCVGSEEGVELADDQISPETFPWKAHGLLAGAVRKDAQSDWTQRFDAAWRDINR